MNKLTAPSTVGNQATLADSFARVLQSRRFTTLMLGALIAVVTLIVGQYFQAQLEFTLKLIAILQAPIVFLIAAFTVDDMQQAGLSAQLEAQGQFLTAMSEQHSAMLAAMTSQHATLIATISKTQ